MEYIATKKVTGGKLLRVKCDVEGGILSNVSLTGDFFMHPEDGVSELENALNGMSNETPVRDFVSKLNDLIHEKNFELVGFSASNIAETLVEAIRGGKDSWGSGGTGETEGGDTSSGLDELVRSAISGK